MLLACTLAMSQVAISHATAAMADPSFKVDFDINAEVNDDSMTLLQMTVKQASPLGHGRDDGMEATQTPAPTPAPCDAKDVCGFASSTFQWCTDTLLFNQAWAAMQRSGSDEPNLTFCEEFIECNDNNNDGLLSYNDFYMRNYTADEQEEVLQCTCGVTTVALFAQHDTNSDGYLEIGEFAVDAGTVACLDSNSDGKLSYAELEGLLAENFCGPLMDKSQFGDPTSEPSVCDPNITKSQCIEPPAGCAEKSWSSGYTAGYSAGYAAGYEAGYEAAPASLLAANSSSDNSTATAYDSGYSAGYAARAGSLLTLQGGHQQRQQLLPAK